MIFIKSVNLILVLLICVYLGIQKAKVYEKRYKELQYFQSALNMFKSKLEFTYEPINNIFSDISKIIYNGSSNIFLNTIENKENLNLAWMNSVENNNQFNNEDKDIIKTFGKLLGKTDIKGQVSEIELMQNLIEKQISNAELEKNKNVKLYKTMGIISGLGICIILI